MTADTARNGLEALEKLAEQTYALVLLDLMMPHMNGYAVLEHLATRPAPLRPLVLVLTAGLEPKPIETSLVVGTLHKPFDVELLVETIAACIKTVEPPPVVPTPTQPTEEAN